eukprot:COSAG01_NODE_784_length_13621_cov_68.866829_13_plen_72_part_00
MRSHLAEIPRFFSTPKMQAWRKRRTTTDLRTTDLRTLEPPTGALCGYRVRHVPAVGITKRQGCGGVGSHCI